MPVQTHNNIINMNAEKRKNVVNSKMMNYERRLKNDNGKKTDNNVEHRKMIGKMK